MNISWADSTGITGDNPFEKPFLPLGWFYRVDPNAPPPPRIVITEIMYHPIEEPEFDRKGKPVLDLSEDIHEFIELHNFSQETVTLDNWRISGGIDYAFPEGTSLESGEFVVVARDPKRLAGIKEYKLAGKKVLGPYEGVLSNNGERVRVENAAGDTEDSVRYSAQFPWPIGADSIGAGRNGPGSTRWITSSAAACWSESTFRCRAMTPPTGWHRPSRKTPRLGVRTTSRASAPCRCRS